MTMILGAVATAGGLWILRRLVHLGIERGLRAPRVLHAHLPNAFGLAPDRIQQVHIPTAGGKRLTGRWVLPPPGFARPAPAVLVMHGWGSNAAMMGPVVPPLHSASFAVLLIDARCHGHSDDETFTSMPRFAEDIASGLAWPACGASRTSIPAALHCWGTRWAQPPPCCTLLTTTTCGPWSACRRSPTRAR